MYIATSDYSKRDISVMDLPGEYAIIHNNYYIRQSIATVCTYVDWTESYVYT